MNVSLRATENLFSYGTLRLETVQLANFGRTLEGVADALVGYRMEMITIEDQEFAARSGSEHRNLEFTGSATDVVEGTVFQVTREELEQADAYEPEDYERVLATTRAGVDVWVYLSP